MGEPVKWDWRTSLRRLPVQPRTILLTCLFGVGGGLAAVAFQFALNWLYDATFLRLAAASKGTFLAGSFVVIVVTATASGFLLNSFAKEAAGSGIPQVKLAFWKEFGAIPWRVIWVKFVAGVLTVGGGSSLGREGPSVHIAAGLTSNLAGLLGEPKQNRRRATAAGAAAGLAAAFNTPLASVTFVLEEIMEDLNSRFLGSALLAAVIGALVVHGLIGPQPAFTLSSVRPPSWRAYALTPLVAAVAALAGIAFQWATLRLRAHNSANPRLPGWLRPSIGAVLTWALGATVFLISGRLGVFGLGYADLSDALDGRLPWILAGCLLVTKLLATIFCYGFGGAGGIFSPTLCFGGMSGVFICGLMGHVMALAQGDRTCLAVVGMSACLGAVVRAPVTGILIVFEMTHEFSLVPTLMVGAIVSQAVARYLAEHNFYEAILRQDGHILERVIPPRDLQGWQQLPVSTIASFQPAVVTDTSSAKLRELLRSQPYQRFPVVRDGKIAGVLTRAEAERAATDSSSPKIEPAVSCAPNRTIGELQSLLLNSTTLFVVLVDTAGGVLGVVTLHDLLRAELGFGTGPG
jgi:CIC family chloride channel protein